MKTDFKSCFSVHYGVQCSQCKIFPITGIRYKCIECPSYNLCEKCEMQFGRNHGHCLLKLRNNTDIEFFNFKNKEDFDIVKCINKTNIFTTKNNNNSLTIPVILLNNGKNTWNAPFFFTCMEKSYLKGERIKINNDIKPNKKCSLNIKIDLSKINKTGIYETVWCLKNEKGEKIGNSIVFKIKNNFENKLSIKPYILCKKIDINLNEVMEPITTDEFLKKKGIQC